MLYPDGRLETRVLRLDAYPGPFDAETGGY
jgi:hypothetical protein